jgi:hypothetical protein
MATEADGDGAVSDAQLARRLQILATEHWGLLAARSTAQNEVLARITIYLTLVSAGLVTIGLLGQATKFGSWFAVAALAILGFLSVVGLFTLARVLTASEEDMMYVVAMNRIRGAYAEVDRVAADAFLASTHDDEIGMAVTYSFLRYRGSLEQVLGSSAMLSLLVNALVGGMFFGGLCAALGMPVGGAVGVGAVACRRGAPTPPCVPAPVRRRAGDRVTGDAPAYERHRVGEGAQAGRSADGT